jgi:hypothetical protein
VLCNENPEVAKCDMPKRRNFGDFIISEFGVQHFGNPEDKEPG